MCIHVHINTFETNIELLKVPTYGKQISETNCIKIKKSSENQYLKAFRKYKTSNIFLRVQRHRQRGNLKVSDQPTGLTWVGASLRICKVENHPPGIKSE